MIDSPQLLTDLKPEVTRLEDDLRKRCEAEPAVDAPLRAQYDAAREKGRTALTYAAWREDELTQIAVAWILGCVFIRFLEDNGLVETLHLAGPDAAGIQRARDQQIVFFREKPGATEREYLEQLFTVTGRLPAMAEFFDRAHNPLWLAGPSGDAARALVEFWRKADPHTGRPVHDFSDPAWETRFLGDLYQSLSEAAQEKFALLQTPVFVEEFILDRTLTPAIETFGLREVRMIDPTCGSGHFLLGGFARLFRLWQETEPGENPRVLAQRALDGIHGVDLNPYAVAIARFRLLLAALRVSSVARLAHAPDFKIHLAVGDSLLHGPEPGVAMDASVLRLRIEASNGTYQAEDPDALAAILSRHYHAVVGNPPYITVKDKALSDAYRAVFPSCSGKYSLAVPFMERFFDLAVKGGGTPQQPAGFVGKITANSWMKREFGKKLIEQFFPRWDITHVIDTSGAYIPGHGTPTVILFGKNQPPATSSIRTVLGILGEPTEPEDPTQGIVWKAILAQIDEPGSESEWMSAADSPRVKFHKHPWSIGGGGASELKEAIDGCGEKTLGAIADQLRGKPNIGITAFTLEDDAFIQPDDVLRRHGLEPTLRRTMVEGDTLRDWQIGPNDSVVWPYDHHFEPIPDDGNNPALRLLWLTRTNLANNFLFGRQTKVQAGLKWYEFGRLTAHKLRPPLSILWGEVATHNHFVLDRGGNVFKNSTQVLKLPQNSTESDHLRLLGVLNSSIACFWLRQVCQPKGTVTGDISSERGRPEANRFSFNASAVAKFPVPSPKTIAKFGIIELAERLDAAAKRLSELEPTAVLHRWFEQGSNPTSLKGEMSAAASEHSGLKAHAVMLQEELDWANYAMFGISDEPSIPNLLSLGPDVGISPTMRPFVWLSEEAPPDIPTDLKPAYIRRRAAIEANSQLQLVENGACKRPWLGRQGVYGSAPATYSARQVEACKEWLVTRLESYFFGGERVAGANRFAPAGFRPATTPALSTTNQLAGVAQTDHAFLAVAELLQGGPGFSVPKLVRELVESASVPSLPVQRYKPAGLLKRRDWEHVWELQREEDRLDAARAALEKRIADRVATRLRAEQPALVATAEQTKAALEAADRAFHERFHAKRAYDPEHPHYAREGFPADPAEALAFMDVQKLHRAWQDAEHALEQARLDVTHSDEQCLAWLREIDALPEKPRVPVPPKYGSTDFRKSVWWSLRGKLDVPKERWIFYPGTERAEDPSPVIAWAGWDHAQQARALAEYYVDAKQTYGFKADKLTLLLASLLELQPWLNQWHSAIDPAYGASPAEAIRAFLDAESHALGVTKEDLERERM